MKKDNRIYRPERLSDKEKKGMVEAVNSFYDKHYGKGCKDRKQAELEKIKNDPNTIIVNGKMYDKRYYKGVK